MTKNVILFSRIKSFIPALFMVIIYFTTVSANAQDDPVINYLQHTGDYAEIYNGKMEAVYNIMQYKSFPYYMNSDFTEASIIYKNIYYPNQKVRLDLFKEQVILLPPEKQFGIILSFQNVEKVNMYNKTFVRMIPPKESGLKQGYYIQLLGNEKMQLYCKVYFNLVQKDVIYYGFERGIRYYLLYNNRYYPVKNKGSFTKLFPQYKKQINKYSKDNKLNFKQNTDESLISLAGYCEELVTSTNKQ